MSLQEQRNQIAYWCDYLNSLLKSNSSTTSKILLVGLRSDTATNNNLISPDSIQAWKQTWVNLSLHDELFFTSKKNKQSIIDLFHTIKTLSSTIMKNVPELDPTASQFLFSKLQQTGKSIISLSELEAAANTKTLHSAFNYLLSIGKIVKINENTICINPPAVSQIMSNFICPVEVQNKLPHITNGRVEILTTSQVGALLCLQQDDVRLFITNSIVSTILTTFFLV